MSEPRKHHVVPAFYLKRWEERGQLLVVDKQLNTAYRARADRVARETDFYRLDEEVFTEGDPLRIERLLGAVEGLMAETIVDLVDRGCPIDDNHVEALAMFYATWVFRSHEYRDRVQRTVDSLSRSGRITASNRHLAQWMAGRGASSMLLWSEKDFETLRSALVNRRWKLVSTPTALLACDTPNRWRDDIAEPLIDIFLPLSPHHLVVAVPRNFPVPTVASAAQVAGWNSTLVGRARRWIFAVPSQRDAIAL